MACTLTTGRALPCKNSVGGIKAIYLADYGTLGALTVTAGEVTAIAGTPTLFKYDIKGTANTLETTITSSRDNGSTFYSSALNITLPYLDKASQEEIKIIASARPHVFVRDYNDNYFLVGAVNGAEIVGGTIVTGGAMGDLSGFTLSFLAEEKLAPYFVTESIITTDESATQIDPEA